jgi:hypothetical protein
MVDRRRVLGLLICGFSIFRLEAATISFLVIETGLPEEMGASQHSGLWESGFLDVFFEAGHIVSNAPVLRLSHNPTAVFPEEARVDLAEAVEGGAEYFILALLDYPAPISQKIPKPRQISLRIFRTKPQTLLYEGQYVDTGSTTLKDEYDSLKKAVQQLVPHVRDR